MVTAGTQLGYVLEMYATLKYYKDVDLYISPEGRSLTRHLRVQQHFESNPAPVHSLKDIKEMFKASSEDVSQFQLMLIAFITAARIGSLQYLQNLGPTKGGWKVMWADHKTLESRGQQVVTIPIKLLTPDIKKILKETPKSSFFCTAKEQEELRATLQAVYDNRTYTIRRSALQHMRDNLNMTPAQIILISLHKDITSLERYLVNPVSFE